MAYKMKACFAFSQPAQPSAAATVPAKAETKVMAEFLIV